MRNEKSAPKIDLRLLSAREKEVVQFVAHGLTDGEIAGKLNISPSTVNSYWMRIRGKLGSMSRMEVVIAMLQTDCEAQIAQLKAENKELAETAKKTQAELAQATHDLRAIRGDSWHLLALDCVPDAIFVGTAPDTIVYANVQAQLLFSADPGELQTRRLHELMIDTQHEHLERSLLAFFRTETTDRMVIGVEEPCYCLRQNGENFRAVIVIEGFEAPEGFMAVLTVREYFEDAVHLIKALRRPFSMK